MDSPLRYVSVRLYLSCPFSDKMISPLTLSFSLRRPRLSFGKTYLFVLLNVYIFVFYMKFLDERNKGKVGKRKLSFPYLPVSRKLTTSVFHGTDTKSSTTTGSPATKSLCPRTH